MARENEYFASTRLRTLALVAVQGRARQGAQPDGPALAILRMDNKLVRMKLIGACTLAVFLTLSPALALAGLGTNGTGSNGNGSNGTGSNGTGQNGTGSNGNGTGIGQNGTGSNGTGTGHNGTQCRPGTVDVGGVCVPTGCSVGGPVDAGTLLPLLLGVGGLAAAARGRRR